MISGRRQTSLIREKRDTIYRVTADVDASTGIYVIGGNNQDCLAASLLSDVDRYTANDAWDARAPLVCPNRQGAGAARVEWGAGESALHVVGGNIGYNTMLNDNDRYIPDYWTAKLNAPGTLRYKGASFQWQSRNMVWAGGRYYGGPTGGVPTIAETARYDAAVNGWMIQAAMPYPRGNPADFTIGSRGFVCGGWQQTVGTWIVTRTTWEFNGGWFVRTDMPTPSRAEHHGFHIGAYGYVVGGSTDSTPTVVNDVDRYAAVNDTWSAAQTAPVKRADHTCGSLADNGYLHGGTRDGGGQPIDAYGFNDSAGWFVTAALPVPSRYLAASDTL